MAWPMARRLGFHIGIQQGLRRDRQRDPHHGGGDIQGVPVLPRLAAAARHASSSRWHTARGVGDERPVAGDGAGADAARLRC